MTWRNGLTWWSPWAAVTSAPPSRGSGTSTGICRIWRDGRWQKYGPRATTSSIASRSWSDSWTGGRAQLPGRGFIVRVLEGGSESPGLGWHHALLLTEAQWAAMHGLGENSCL